MCPDDSRSEVEDSSLGSDDAGDILSSPHARRVSFNRRAPFLAENNIPPSISFPPNSPSFAVRCSTRNESYHHHQPHYAPLDDRQNTSSSMHSRYSPVFTFSPESSGHIVVSGHSTQDEETSMLVISGISLEPGETMNNHIDSESVPATFTTSSSQHSLNTPTSISTIYVVETPPRSQQRTRPRSPSWGPDLQDMFSPARSEIDSVILGSEVSSPVTRIKAKPESWDPPDYRDVEDFRTPGPQSVQKLADDEGLDVEDEDDLLSVPACKDSLEAKWREKWVNTTSLLSKRKVRSLSWTLMLGELADMNSTCATTQQEAISPRKAPYPKRSSQPGVGLSTRSPSPSAHMSSTTSARASTGPRRSWPLLGTSVQNRMRKPLSRRNGAAILVPASGQQLRPRNLEVLPLDLNAFKHKYVYSNPIIRLNHYTNHANVFACEDLCDYVRK